MAEEDNIRSGEPEERKMAEEWVGRSPDDIRDDAVRDWHQRAPLKYNEGQKHKIQDWAKAEKYMRGKCWKY